MRALRGVCGHVQPPVGVALQAQVEGQGQAIQAAMLAA